MTRQHLVFVYGTLKRGFANHHYLACATFEGVARTRERFPLVVQGPWFTPCLIDEQGEGHAVEGEAWRVDDAELARLDELESVGLPNGYHRRALAVTLIASNETLVAYTYLKVRAALGVIHGEPLAVYRDTRYVAPHARPLGEPRNRG